MTDSHPAPRTTISDVASRLLSLEKSITAATTGAAQAEKAPSTGLVGSSPQAKGRLSPTILLHKGFRQLRFGELLRSGRVEGPDSQVGNYKEGEDEEGTSSHRPREPDLVNQPADHNGENDAAQAGTRGKDAKCRATLLVKPSVNAAHGYPRAQHESKDMEKGASKDELARSVLVV
ncbi:hypothetical protein MY1884_005903 [Beauveria asiatica]